MLVLLLTLPVCTLMSFVVVLTLFTIHRGVHHVEADSTYQAHGISVTAFILPYSTLDHLWGHQRSVWFSCELISASCSLTQSAEVSQWAVHYVPAHSLVQLSAHICRLLLITVHTSMSLDCTSTSSCEHMSICQNTSCCLCFVVV